MGRRLNEWMGGRMDRQTNELGGIMRGRKNKWIEDGLTD